MSGVFAQSPHLFSQTQQVGVTRVTLLISIYQISRKGHCVQQHASSPIPAGFPQLAVTTQAREPPGNELTCMHPPLFSGNVDTTLSRGCSDIGLYHGTKTLQYQSESIAGTANIPRREGRTRSFKTLNIQLSVGARRLTVCTCFLAKTSTQVKLT